MIKILSAAIRNPGANRSLDEFHTYWSQKHGPLFAHTPQLRRYVQHLSLPEAYEGEPTVTHDGASMFWFDDVDGLRNMTSPKLIDAIPENSGTYEWYVKTSRYGDPTQMTLSETVRADDRQLFDRTPDWPLHHKRTSVLATERIVLDGPTRPEMVKMLIVALRRPGLSPEEFSQYWFEVHGPLGAQAPGIRRYVQNHAVPEASAVRAMTHDGFAEMWFDDLASVRSAMASPEWKALREDGDSLFARPVARIIAREGVIKG